MTPWLRESLGEHTAWKASKELNVYILAKAQCEGPMGDPVTLHKHLKCENNKEEQEFLILVPNVLLALRRERT